MSSFTCVFRVDTDLLFLGQMIPGQTDPRLNLQWQKAERFESQYYKLCVILHSPQDGENPQTQKKVAAHRRTPSVSSGKLSAPRVYFSLPVSLNVSFGKNQSAHF